jgi:hypothetical protein
MFLGLTKLPCRKGWSVRSRSRKSQKIKTYLWDRIGERKGRFCKTGKKEKKKDVPDKRIIDMLKDGIKVIFEH